MLSPRIYMLLVFADHKPRNLISYFQDPAVSVFSPALVEPFSKSRIVLLQTRKDGVIGSDLVRLALDNIGKDDWLCCECLLEPVDAFLNGKNECAESRFLGPSVEANILRYKEVDCLGI